MEQIEVVQTSKLLKVLDIVKGVKSEFVCIPRMMIPSETVKGISDNILRYHEYYMKDCLMYMFSLIEKRDYESAISDLNNFRNDYLNLKLSPGYYREFDNRSLYCTKYKYNGLNSFIPGIATEDQLKDIDISFNNNILMQLHQILVRLIDR